MWETLRLLLPEANRLPALVEQYFQRFMDPVADRLRSRVLEAVARNDIRDVGEHLTDVILAAPLARYVWLLLFAHRRPMDGGKLFQAQVESLLHGILPPTGQKARLGVWSGWRTFPNKASGEPLIAPPGPGLYQLRGTRSGPEFGISRNLAARLARVVGDGMEYRTLGCASYAEAKARYPNEVPPTGR